MPTRPWLRGIAFASRSRRRAAAATLSATLTLPVALLGTLAVPGCRTESSSARLPSLSAMRWFGRGEAAVTDEGVELQPVPEDGVFERAPERVEAPPLPPTSIDDDVFSPPPPPSPETFGPDDAEGFYGVRPTGAEIKGPKESEWTNRFRGLFRRETPSASRKVSVRTAEAVARPPVPPALRIPRRAAVTLGSPEFDSAAEERGPVPAVERVSRTEAVWTVGRSGPEPLPVIVPGRGATARPTNVAAEPAAWPHADAEPIAVAPAPLPVIEPEPQPLRAEPAAPLVVPQSGEVSGPALSP